jgi:hypothetical protein
MNATRHITAALVAATIGLGATPGVEAAAITFSLQEYSATNVLTTTMPGAVVVQTGPESWIVDFTATPVVLLFEMLDRVWLDAEPGYINQVIVLDDKHLSARSDILLETFQPTANSYCNTGAPLPNGATCLIGHAADNYFVTWTYPTPIPAAVWLFGSALGVMGVMRRKFTS